MVEGAVLVECVVEGSCESVRVSDEKQFGVFSGGDSLNGVEYELVYAGGFVDDNEDVSTVESLESVFGVCGESVSVSCRRIVETCACEFSA